MIKVALFFVTIKSYKNALRKLLFFSLKKIKINELNCMTKKLFITTQLICNLDKTSTHNFLEPEQSKNKWLVISVILLLTTHDIKTKFCIPLLTRLYFVGR